MLRPAPTGHSRAKSEASLEWLLGRAMTGRQTRAETCTFRSPPVSRMCSVPARSALLNGQELFAQKTAGFPADKSLTLRLSKLERLPQGSVSFRLQRPIRIGRWLSPRSCPREEQCPLSPRQQPLPHGRDSFGSAARAVERAIVPSSCLASMFPPRSHIDSAHGASSKTNKISKMRRIGSILSA